MISKAVFLDVICHKKPYYLTIMIDDCFMLKKAKINSFSSKFCICTKNERLTIIASYKTQAVYKTIYLNNKPCENICVNFLFNKTFSQRSNNIIKLLDVNYGFPVEKALLNFKQ